MLKWGGAGIHRWATSAATASSTIDYLYDKLLARHGNWCCLLIVRVCIACRSKDLMIISSSVQGIAPTCRAY